jgi:PKD repeat protein
VLTATLCAATLTLWLGVSQAGAIIVRIGGHNYGVTPINGVSPLSIRGAYRAPGASRTGPRNLDELPTGGGPLLNHGGPVMHSVTTHVIYWDPTKEFTVTTKEIFSNFFTDVAHDKELASNVFPVAGQYKDGSGHAAYVATVGSEGTDSAAYPSTGNCAVPLGDPGPPYTKCLFDSQLQTELLAYISAEKLPTGPAQQYFLLLPHKVVTCFNQTKEEEEKEIAPGCSNNVFCAYHSAINRGTPSEIIYSDIPFSLLDSVENTKGCQNDTNPTFVQHPNGDATGGTAATKYADVALKYTSHEYTEAATDPLGTAYFDANGLENGDKCNGVEGPPSGIGSDKNAFLPTLGGEAENGTLFNQSINADHYYLQSEWDNAAAACLMRPVAIASAGFTSAPTPASTGGPISFTGTATDIYAGLGFVWKWGDGTESAGATPTHVYAAPGSYEVTMTVKDELTGSTTAPVAHTIVVNDQPTASFTIAPNPATPGTPMALNGGGSIDPDGAITNYAWNFGDGSVGAGATPSHMYGAPGTYTVTLTVTDSGGQTGTTTHTVTVGAAPQGKSSYVPPNSSFTHREASFNQVTGVITLTETVGDPGTFSWLLTFQNGKFGVFAASNHSCKARFVRLAGKCRPSRIVLAKGSQAVARAGVVTLKLKASASALKALKNALKQKKGLPVTITLTFQSARGGSPVSDTRVLTVKLTKKARAAGRPRLEPSGASGG